MPSLNKIFKEALLDVNYCYSVFDYDKHYIEDLQICHILSNSLATKKAVTKAYNCDKKIAEMLTNMPLLNTVVGTRQDNIEYKKTDDIVNINIRLINIVKDIFNNHLNKYCLEELLKIKVFSDLYARVSCAGRLTCINIVINDIKEIQYCFHRELGIYH